MPLHLTVKPGDKIIINGGVISNTSPRTMKIMIHNKVQLMLEKEVILPEAANTPLLRIYFALQCMYLDEDNVEKYREIFDDLAMQLIQATKTPELLDAVEAARASVYSGRLYQGLRALRAALPTEAALLSPIASCRPPAPMSTQSTKQIT